MAVEDSMLDNATMAEAARGRASLYELLVGVFGALPDRALIMRIKSQELKALLDGCYGLDNPRFKDGVDCINSYRSNIELKSDEDSLTELSVDRTRIIRATGQPNLRPPYEGLYMHDKGARASTLEVKTFYREAGLLPDETIHEPPDYLCLELDFMKNLCRREQEQWSSAADATETVVNEERFLREHLGRWVGEFCSQAEQQALTDFYRGFLVILDAVVSTDMEYTSNLMQALRQ